MPFWHEVAVDRNAFARARSFLKYRTGAKWLAIVAGIGTAVLYVLLLLVLSLFGDLLIHRGRIPTLSQLTLGEQEQFVNDWAKLSAEQRGEIAKHLGVPGPSSPLIATTDLPPVPARMTREALEKWAGARKIASDNLYLPAMFENELRWRGYVWLQLRELVSDEAANSYQSAVKSYAEFPYPALGIGNTTPHGALSLVVRQR